MSARLLGWRYYNIIIIILIYIYAHTHTHMYKSIAIVHHYNEGVTLCDYLIMRSQTKLLSIRSYFKDHRPSSTVPRTFVEDEEEVATGNLM